ncbi:MAG TPA: pantoate--beta-alanine ligase [Ktedonobacteraceae bacterium]|nr:pantoate--beta-alanine ligase [Ktedonobacteraceae bacterium]
MRVVTTIEEMVQERLRWTSSSTVGLVPTMGYLHEGHLSLVRQGRKENDRLTASIFVNPTQFGPEEDLERYPRNMPRDLELLEAAGVDLVFAPTANTMYPPGFITYVEPTGPLVTEAEGAHRPGHFRGVATVVLKLFQILRPHQAYFGQKDAQQVVVISHMVADLNLPVQLRVLSTIREADGLAMSSRNAYLHAQNRAAATILYQALEAGRRVFDEHTGGNPQLVKQAMVNIVATEPRALLEYADVRDPDSFLPLSTLHAPALLAITATVGPARLIDNFLLHASGEWDTGIRVQNQ